MLAAMVHTDHSQGAFQMMMSKFLTDVRTTVAPQHEEYQQRRPGVVAKMHLVVIDHCAAQMQGFNLACNGMT